MADSGRERQVTMFTKKHYKAIAEIIKSEYMRYDGTGENDYEGKDTVGCIAGKLADYFEQNNPRCEKTNTGFNRNRFMKACGL